MNEKYFTVSEEGTNKQFKLIMSYNSSTINLEMQSKDNPKEKYELKNLTLSYFNQIKAYKQYDTIKKIVDVITSKLEKKNFILRTGCVLNIQFTGPQDDISYVPFVIKNIGTASSIPSTISDSQLRAENERLKKENLELRAQIEKLSSGGSIKKPANSTNSYIPPKTNINTPSKAPSAQKPTPPPTTKPKPVPNPPSSNIKPSQPEIQIVGTYVPPSMNKSGNIFDRINQTIKLKNDMKKTLDEIFNRLNDTKNRIDNFVDKAFANNPTAEDKKKALNLITEVLLLRQGFKDIDNYQEIFQNEVKEKGIRFNSTEKEKFDDSMLILGKSFPYALTPYHQKIDHLLIQTIHNFFIEKNLRFYKPKELEEVQKMREKLK